MPTFTGNLRDFGLELLTGLHPQLRFDATGPGVSVTGAVYATRTITVDPDDTTGDFSVDLASTTALAGRVRIRVSIGWLVSGQAIAYDELPVLLDIPETDGTIGDLVVASGIDASNLIFIGPTPPPSSNWLFWLDTSGVPLYPTELPGLPYLRPKG